MAIDKECSSQESNPEVLLLDEPTEGVDIGARRDIFLRIVDAAKSGVTVLYSRTETQDLAELCHCILAFEMVSLQRVLQGVEVAEEAISRMCWAALSASRRPRRSSFSN